jgi:Ca2+-binding RTX toxin-like protein
MKKKIVTLLAVLAAGAAPLAHAEDPSEPSTANIVLAGGASQNSIHIWLTPDGYDYVIDSAVPLDAGGTICSHPPESPNQLICEAPSVTGFVVIGGNRDDTVTVARSVQVPLTMKGGPGKDTLLGGSGSDLVIGGPGEDRLGGRAGNDVVYAGPGNDVVWGGAGDDVLHGGPGRDTLLGGSGDNVLLADTEPSSRLGTRPRY